MNVESVTNGDSEHVRKHSELPYFNDHLLKVTQQNRSAKQWLFRQNVTSEQQGTPFVTVDGAVVACLETLVASISLRRPGFNPRPAHVEFVVVELSPAQVSF
jgi:hypothetical protein